MSSVIYNPIFIGIFCATIVYIYLYWDNNRNNKKNNTNKQVNLSIPIITGLVMWFLSAYILSDNVNSNIPIDIKPLQNNKNIISESCSYHLIGKNNIRLPHADVFIDIARF